MRINHNVPALNTYRHLNRASNAQQGSMQKLSSGLRINNAADDAAGLTISEKMRAQVRGLDQASANAQDGISLIQTAEGALQETQDILQRMRELAVQSSNDTNTNTDRAEIQKEVNQLTEEITRIGNNTEYNTQKLLDGNYDGKTFHIGANKDQNIKVSIADMRAQSLDVGYNYEVKNSETIDYTSKANPDFTTAKTATFIAKGDELLAEKTAENIGFYKPNGEQVELANGATDADALDNMGYFQQGAEIKIDEETTKTVDKAGYYDKSTGVALFIGDEGSLNGVIHYIKDAVVVESTTAETSGYYSDDTKELILQADEMLKTGSEGVAALNVSTQEQANKAIQTFDNAINTVSGERSKLGAFQNRLEHTIKNLGTSSENLTSAESRIRDVDMAAEIMELTKNSILAQASQAMLAQANQLPQGVLQLLR